MDSSCVSIFTARRCGVAEQPAAVTRSRDPISCRVYPFSRIPDACLARSLGSSLPGSSYGTLCSMSEIEIGSRRWIEVLLDTYFHDCLHVRFGASGLNTLVDSVCFWRTPRIAIPSVRIRSCPGFLAKLLAQLPHSIISERYYATFQWPFNHVFPIWYTHICVVPAGSWLSWSEVGSRKNPKSGRMNTRL